MPEKDVKTLIDTEPDFIAIRRYSNSLTKLLVRYPNGAPDRVIAAALEMTVEEVQAKYEQIVQKLREKLKIDDWV